MSTSTPAHRPSCSGGSSGSSSTAGSGGRGLAAACALALALVLGATACENQYYCEGKNPLNNCLAEATGEACKTTADCAATPSTPVCNLEGTMTCVQCTLAEPAACKGQTPVCGGTQCRGCTLDSECGSGTCQPDGACGSDQTVAYVDPAGSDNTLCTKAMPCTKVDKAVKTGRPFVRFAGTTDERVVVDNTTVSFFAAPGGKLTSTSNGILLEVKGGSALTIYDLEITGASGPNGIGISMPAGNTATLSLVRAKLTSNTAGGLVVTNGTVKMNQSQIIANTGGGVSVTAARFELVNNFIVKNGGPMSTFGGVYLNQISTTGNVFDFNTVTRNQGADNITTGVTCSANSAAVSLTNSIVYGNTVNGTGKQVSTDNNCTWTYSNIGPEQIGGASNISLAPMFVDSTANRFQLLSGSPGQDRADMTTSVRVDIDGDARPQGAGPDMGADEIK